MKDNQPQTIYLKDYSCPDFVIDETHLRFQLYEDGARVTSNLHLRRNPEADSFNNILSLDGLELQLEHVVLDGRELQANEYVLSGDGLVIENLPAQFQLSIVTWILPQENTCLEGLYRSNTMFCTQCEAEGFRRITYYLDRPDVMSVFTTTVEADKARYPVLLSNGNPIEEGDLGDRHWITWHDPFKKPCYLFALVAGDLQYVESWYQTQSRRDIRLRIYVAAHDLDKCDHAMDSLKRSMKWDEEVYGREYDLDIFNIVAVSDFNMGAMENKGLNIFNSSCVLANIETATDATFQRVEAIVAHEYFHNWSGNRVTCRDWFQLSLKEGFTVFRDAEFSADMHSRAVKRIEDVEVLRTAQFAEDAGPMAHPVRPDSYIEISNFYTLTVYEKGAEVVRMIHTLLGAETFRLGTDLYFSRHDGQAVTTDDFVLCMEEVSGRDLGQFKRWYSQAGTPRVNVNDEYDPATKTYTLHFQQKGLPSTGQVTKEPYVIPVKVGLLGADGKGKDFSLAADEEKLVAETVLELTQQQQSFHFYHVDEPPVPSLFRGFSAPVKANFPYTREQLRFLSVHDSDGFNRWDAGQNLALDILEELVSEYQADRLLAVDEIYLSAFATQLDQQQQIEYSMLAKLLAVPTISLLAERAEVIDIDAILAAREALMSALVAANESLLISNYQRMTEQLSRTGLDTRSSEAMGLRACRNACLSLLVQGDSEFAVNLAEVQLQQASNMTDELGAMQTLVNSSNEEAAKDAVDYFHDKWRQDSLVMDSWFGLQASSPVFGDLERIRRLTQHSLFSEKNPNKVRSVIGAFAGQNWKQFHQADGMGYQFLKEWVLILDNINPQIAARLVTPMTRWRKFAGERKQQLQECLTQIKRHSNLSKDVYEVVMKSLQ